ncbi:UDP-2,3-diacylglucosamine diphosphatase [Alkalitalea saponilacus]|uniref:UDP-2,3-diacylglucosamine hydrolase n=1 Tax=Alkalitalea saponilacus TaxID=889453 RepID=A0A1T5HTA1_9BACT|nr:UDP-2,3-diacylglucosamine diphosphatase [Alkalitalea saponilacus]ASB48958.1 UDP-2,3-diacylglucosamine hydrolase [Alkalitalea saponilacus]SKC23896.1 UDP-2,3-diacylglucosamine hydrolase [Alkalitalea saponilacus]
MEQKKKIYFASDVHLGAPTIKNPQEHERRFVRWLDSVKHDASEIYLLGDIFDFWFEYRRAIPKGYSRFIGKLCELTDSGIPVHFFTGNHDIWVFDYLPTETGIQIYRKPLIREIDGKKFFLAHGDGLTRFEKSYNRLKAIFTNNIAQKLFRLIHPDCGVWFARLWSGKSREKNLKSYGSVFQGEDKEWLIVWAKEQLEVNHFDFFVFGHRHIAKVIDLKNNSKLIYLGDWVNHYSYGVWDGNTFNLEFFEHKN